MKKKNEIKESMMNIFKQKRIVLITLLLVMFYTTIAAQNQTVRNLRVEDIPADDGSGLRVVWEPITDINIISYKIYRGTSRDTLFYIGEMNVNPKAGISSETMSFYDKDWSSFVT
ncbi:MAG: hypothetical protein FWG20_01200, partial [Candidatus Cloacimonetes bacterium]|nr:hypothetical protein [Candidatus Cloacimonadota bacterium]